MAKDPSQHNSCGPGTRQSTHLQPPGAGDAPPVLSPPNGGSEVYVALITANMLRLRREWALAEAKCSEVLQLDPENATAHSLMGDVLRDQGRVADAIEWYKLALDHNPSSEADRKKLEALIDQAFPERPKGLYGAVRSRLGRWAKAATAEVRAARPVCPWATVAAAILGVIMLAAFAAVLIARRPPPAPEASSTAAGAGAFVANEAAEDGEGQPLQTALPAEITGDIPALEQAMFERVKRRAAEIDPNCRVAAVEVDPRQASIEIRLSMPELWAPRDQRESLLRVAAALAVVATSETPFAAVKVRGSTRPSAGPERLAMVADGSGESIRSAEEAGATTRPSELFEGVWWRPELAESNGTKAAGEP